ncbi:NACHT domain-containing protein [Leptolyngbya ohadii]|uniref:NACHT domain-containing protein n=1 Tax=Leptolyngbya ohadii TaxID=1962290 RepID=UPI000B5996FD|nr:NACHT domain-containing protein [Leptolyngbya ohadii]
MTFFITREIAEVLRRAKQARGYSLKYLLDRMTQISSRDVPSKSTLEGMLKGNRRTKEETFNLLIQALDLDKQQVLIEAEKIIDWKQAWHREFLKQPQSTISHILSGDGFALKNSPSFFEPNLVSYSRPARYPHEVCTYSKRSSVNTLKKLTFQKFTEVALHSYLTNTIVSPARIVLVGESGIGKTTLLNKIGELLFEYKERSVDERDRLTVIRIHLPDLKRSETIESYIFSLLLKRVLGQHIISENAKFQLTGLFKEGKVWLLLDGVDEVIHHSKDFLRLEQQLKGVIAQANIITTCCLNTWENESNLLRDVFPAVYELQGLDSGTDQNLGHVGKFINHCLSKNLAKWLIRQLQDPKHAATRSLTANPLSLTLLCYTAHRWQEQDGLPATKDQIYRKFVEYMYKAKLQLAVIDEPQQQELNQALGLLAFRSLDESSSPYRLPRSFVLQVWQEAKLSLKLLHLFEKLGFLGQMGVAEENPDERVFFFLNSSLQEHFAARMITDRKMLLNLNSNHQSNVVDRVLQLRWNGVYLFCMGGNRLTSTQKEELLQDLINRNNYCNDYYYHFGVCLAAQGVAEFKSSCLGDAIVHQLVDWSLEDWNPDKQPRDYQSIPRINMAARYLKLSDSERVVEYLTYQLELSRDNCDRSYQVASRLASLEEGKLLSIEELVRLLQCNSQLIRDNAALLLSDLKQPPPALIEYLNHCLATDFTPSGQLFAIDLFCKIGRKTPELVAILANLYETSHNPDTQKSSASLLSKLAPKHPYASLKQAQTSANNFSSTDVPLKEVLKWLPLLETENQSKESCRLVYQLQNWLHNGHNLGRLLQSEGETIRVIRILKKWLNTSANHSFEFLCCNQSLYFCAQFVPYNIFCQGWNL